ncbi:hypothetical protein FOA52_005089 [Chlamydomonas sp. UWO 241]|nr:hypothetical protein FOA52_005089 [Chlamydomonas sp. UWO 241]
MESAIHRPVAGFHRTDSESAFQEFLKKIPSSTNLASLGGLEANQPGSGVFAASIGLRRVSSFDQLRSLGQQPSNGGVVKVEVGRAGLLGAPPPMHGVAGLPSIAAAGALYHGAVPPPPFLAVPPAPALAATPGGGGARGGGAARGGGRGGRAAATPASRAQRQRSASVGTDDSDGSGADDGIPGADGKVTERKTRRMLSNRESARRSRRRKQEHLGTLEGEIAVLVEEKKSWVERMSAAEKRLAGVRDEGRRLHEENERLRDELQFLRSEFKAGRGNGKRDKADGDA